MFVSTEDLAARLDDASWTIFDCRHDLGDPTKGAEWYAAGHIAGAFFAGVDTVLASRPTGTNGRHPLPEPAGLGEFLAACGVTPTSTLVAYDDVGGQYSARFWWLARWIGLSNVRVLDGGWGKWMREGRAISNEAPPTPPRGRVEPQPDASLWVDVATVENQVRQGDGLVIDARAPERFRGEVEPIDPVAGHIPGACNRFFKTNLNADLTVRPAAELRTEFAATIGDRDPTTVIHQCGSGITACMNLLAMDYAGLPGSKLFVGSWSEWVADPRRPVATGA